MKSAYTHQINIILFAYTHQINIILFLRRTSNSSNYTFFSHNKHSRTANQKKTKKQRLLNSVIQAHKHTRANMNTYDSVRRSQQTKPAAAPPTRNNEGWRKASYITRHKHTHKGGNINKYEHIRFSAEVPAYNACGCAAREKQRRLMRVHLQRGDVVFVFERLYEKKKTKTPLSRGYSSNTLATLS